MAELEAAFRELADLKANLENIGDPSPCLGCHEPTSKKMVDYEHSLLLRGGTRFTIAKNLPGFQCGGCGVDYQDSKLMDRFLATIQRGLVRLGYTRAVSRPGSGVSASIVFSPDPRGRLP